MRKFVFLEIIFSLAILILLINSCSRDLESPEGTDSYGSEWRIVCKPGYYKDYTAHSIFGTSSKSLYVVGDYGVVLHYDGRRWECLHYEDSLVLNDVWASSDNNVFAVGDDGAILYYNGAYWKRMNSPVNSDLYAIWGNSRRSIFAVGENGTVLYFNGRDWIVLATGLKENLWDVCGYNSNVFAVGENGTILYLCPQMVRKYTPITKNDLYGIGGNAEVGLYAVGETGTIIHYNGREWVGINSKTIEDFFKVYAAEDGNIVILTRYDFVRYFFDEKFNTISNHRSGYFVYPSDIKTKNIWGSSINDIYMIINGCLLYYNGDGLKEISLPEVGWNSCTYYDIWGNSDNNIYIVSECGIAKFNGYKLEYIDSLDTGSNQAIWGIDNELYVSTFECLPYAPPPCVYVCTASFWKYCLDTYEFQYLSLPANSVKIRAIWGANSDSLYCAGSSIEVGCDESSGWVISYPAIYRLSGTELNRVYFIDKNGTFNDIWGISETDICAVGLNGLIVHYDGMNWIEENSGVLNDLFGVWGDQQGGFFAVGAQGTILQFDGSQWVPMSCGIVENLYDIWGSSSENIFAVGENGTIVHFNGTDWSVMASPTRLTLFGVWGISPRVVYAVGEDGIIIRRSSL